MKLPLLLSVLLTVGCYAQQEIGLKPTAIEQYSPVALLVLAVGVQYRENREKDRVIRRMTEQWLHVIKLLENRMKD